MESAGEVPDLPVHTFPSDEGGVDMKCPTEIAISDRREAELAASGLMPLIHRKNSDLAAFIGAQSLHKPAEYDDPDATANANLECTPTGMHSTTFSGGDGSWKTHEPGMRAQPFSVDGYLCHVRFLCRLDFKRLRRLCFDILRRRFFFKLPI